MATQGDVTGVIVDPDALEDSKATVEKVGAKDSTIVIKSPETIEADRLAKAGEVQAAIERTASQRKVNMIWEYTQAGIAIAVVLACIAAAFLLDSDEAEMLRNAFFLIVGFYFGRTNHQTQGGVGPHMPLQQSGR